MQTATHTQTPPQFCNAVPEEHRTVRIVAPWIVGVNRRGTTGAPEKAAAGQLKHWRKHWQEVQHHASSIMGYSTSSTQEIMEVCYQTKLGRESCPTSVTHLQLPFCVSHQRRIRRACSVLAWVPNAEKRVALRRNIAAMAGAMPYSGPRIGGENMRKTASKDLWFCLAKRTNRTTVDLEEKQLRAGRFVAPGREIEVWKGTNEIHQDCHAASMQLYRK